MSSDRELLHESKVKKVSSEKVLEFLLEVKALAELEKKRKVDSGKEA